MVEAPAVSGSVHVCPGDSRLLLCRYRDDGVKPFPLVFWHKTGRLWFKVVMAAQVHQL